MKNGCHLSVTTVFNFVIKFTWTFFSITTCLGELNYTGCLELIFRVLDSLGHSANYKLSKGWNSKAESGMEKKDLHATYSYMLFFEK